MSNENRAHHAHAALAHHARAIKSDGPDTDPENALRDMLASLRHYCDANNIDFEDVNNMAFHLYKAEAA